MKVSTKNMRVLDIGRDVDELPSSLGPVTLLFALVKGSPFPSLALLHFTLAFTKQMVLISGFGDILGQSH